MNAERLQRDIIVIGASAGGVEAMMKLFSALPADLAASVVVVIHRSPVHVSHLARVWGRHSLLPVTEAVDGDTLERGQIYLAPADMHLLIESDRFRLTQTPKVHFTRPAADPLFESAAAGYGKRVVGVVLSGLGSDGVNGLIAIKAAGGLSIAQDPDEAAHPSMPVNAIRHDHVDAVLDARQIGLALVALSRGLRVDTLRSPVAAA